ncbi:hypothetical protein A1O7_01983 [Cladophialophora yegresii CBS 114405]|uniref:Uncharacterized protein n=1 Tax=Cladophialophora yegresii CBS 114405 TaxID=1182544 RepID=W9W988_9EURO|nr:uncharacterized protein A1O7_01983 [Cladophialophora yegresii CBS 114405]EXJ61555.1 hypothetical protein A1O7_01983 [Cladophialophora yegresii CBS 114405]
MSWFPCLHSTCRERPGDNGPYSKTQLPTSESSVESAASHASNERDPAESSAWSLVPRVGADEPQDLEEATLSETKTSVPRDPSLQNDVQSQQHVAHRTESHRVNPSLDAYVSAFEVVRATNQRVLDRVFELNSTRGPLLKQIESLLRALDEFVRHITEHPGPSDGNDAPATKVRDLQQQFDTLRNGQFASLQADEARYREIEDDIIQSLHRSGTYLDNLLRSTPTSPNLNHEASTDLPQDPAIVGNGLNEQSADVLRYLTQLGDVDALQEKLSDLYTERAQLLEEQKSKEKLGVSLDDDSLAFLQSSEREADELVEQLEYARLVLQALKQLIDDADAQSLSKDDFPVSEVDEDSAGLQHLEDGLTAQSFQVPLRDRGRQLVVRQRLEAHDNDFKVTLESTDDAALATAMFINAWMLKRLFHLPRTLDRLISIVEQRHPGADLDLLERTFLAYWFNDGSASDFKTRRSLADQQTMRANTLSRYFEPKSIASDTAVPTGSSPLLRLGPSVRTSEIIKQAIRFQGFRSLQVSEKSS